MAPINQTLRDFDFVLEEEDWTSVAVYRQHSVKNNLGCSSSLAIWEKP